MTVKTFGLTHVAFAVTDPERSFRFYERLLGAKLLGKLKGREGEDLSNEDSIEFGTPGCHDAIVLMRAKDGLTGNTGQLEHFGFRLVSRDDPDRLATTVEVAGGTVLEKGRFRTSGEPFVFARDPDGYEIELWFQEDDAPDARD
jgi:catechol 2,3-dioxygenase-like lactoylglutathione lyase family enzyme